jgi:RNA polymerase sigma-70 factor (ECF subfamily)
MDAAEEQRCIEAARKDPGRFAPLYEEHFERVYAYVARRVRDRAEAQDLTAEVFRQALAALPRFEWRGVTIAAWLYRIAANAVADHFNRLSREQGTPAAEGATVSDDVELIERRALLFRLVGGLPADQRQVIELRFGEERSIREIAAKLGRSEGAVKQLQWRAMQTLKERAGRLHG